MRFPWDPTTMLAPLEGVSHPVFRAMMAEHGGLGIVCTEFVRVSRAPLSAANLVRQVVRAPGVPLCVQVMGNEVDKMADAARLLVDAGADAIDLNCGCPAPRVVRKGVGAAMLKDPALLSAVVSAMRRAVKVFLSAKIRAGFDDATNVVGIARTVEDAGCDYVVVHPRRRADFFDGVADWRTIRLLKEQLRIPVVGNGDCWYAADALRMQAETGCDAVMIGRPALRNPWIFRQIAELRAGLPPFAPAGHDLVLHLQRVAERYKEPFAQARFGPLGPIKELVSYLGRAVNDGRAFMREALLQASVQDVLRVAESRLWELPSGALDLGADGHLALERSGRV